MIKKPIEFEMIKTVHLIKRCIDEKVAQTIDKGLTVSQAHLIGFISNEGKDRDIFQRDIEEEFELQRSSVSLMISNMVKNGFIERHEVENDGRLKKLVLTEKAKALQEKISTAVLQVNNELIKDISEEEQTAFLETLSKIKSNIK